MKTLAVIVDFHQLPTLQRTLGDRTVAAWVSGALETALPKVDQVRLGPFASMDLFLEALIDAGRGCDELVIASGDAPFLRAEVVSELVALHRRYRSEYTFGDGFPSGVSAEVLHPRILPTLRSWAVEKPRAATRDGLFAVLQTDINRFDVETHLSPVDLRMKRLQLHADSARNFLLLQRLLAEQGRDLEPWLRLLEADATVAHTLPATLLVQVTTGVLQVPTWSPILQHQPHALDQRTELSRSQWNDLLDSALKFSGDLTVLPAFWGEPSLHSEIEGLLLDALSKPGLRLCIETSGLGWSNDCLTAVSQRAAGRVDWIVELDSNERSTYEQVRGSGFDEAHQFTQTLLELFPGHVWPQTVRMTTNELEMEGFYKHWKSVAGQVILQKHNDFSGRLPRLKPADLSPLKRQPCWHVARDLAVFVDGTVVPCRDDFQRTQELGNVFREDLSVIWQRSRDLLNRHAKEDYPEVCRICDEYYTYSF